MRTGSPGHAPVVDRTDLVVCAVSFVAALVYLQYIPHNLPMADEAYYLGVIKRMAEGQVLYRDVFDFLPPLFHWFFVGVFYAFGVSIESARFAMAVCQALFCVLSYLTCRGIGARRAFALCATVAYLALAQPVWPYVSPHWFSTFLMTLLFYLLFARNWVFQDRRSFALGAVVGILGCTQHHVGVVIAMGVAAVLTLAHAVDGTATWAARGRRIGRSLVRLSAGALCVAIPCLLIAIAEAGVGPVVEALFIMPLRDYTAFHHTRPPWAQIYLMTRSFAAYSIAPVLRWSPIVLPIAVLQALYPQRSPAARAARKSTLLQVVFALFWIGSIFYFPDFIHVAFIFPVFAIIGSAVVEKALPGRTAWGRRGGLAVAAVLLLGLSVHLYGNAARFWRDFPLRRKTAFGMVDFAHHNDLWLLDRVGRVLDETGERRLFCYPSCSLYLTLDAQDPTRHEYLLAVQNPPEHFRQVIDALSANEPPILVFLRAPSDLDDYKQLMEFVKRNYDPIESKYPLLDLYLRKDLHDLRDAFLLPDGRRSG